METVVVSTPQSSQQKSLIKTAPAAQAADARERRTNNSSYQIFSDERYVFKISHTLETLYRYRYDSVTGEVNEKVVFKRVRHDQLENALKNQWAIKMGIVILSGNIEYTLYQLLNRQGYVLCASNLYDIHDISIAEKIYYIFEKE